MQFSFAGRKVAAEPALAGPAAVEGIAGSASGSARRSLIVMLGAFVLAMIAARSPGGDFRGAVWFFNAVREALDGTIIDWIGRPATVGLFFVLGLAGGAALWPWRRGGAVKADPLASDGEEPLAASDFFAEETENGDDAIQQAAGPAGIADDNAEPALAATEGAVGGHIAEAEDVQPSSRILALRARALGAAGPDEGADTLVRGREDGQAVEGVVPEAGDHEAQSIPDAVRASWRRAIVFREHFPPPADPGFSFYGGAPIVPPGFEWPLGNEGAPLHFLMQVDCREISEDGRCGLLPGDAVIHVFLDLEWGGPAGYRVLCSTSPDESWTTAEVPSGLAQLYGDEARHAWPWLDPNAAEPPVELPRLLPRWPFQPVTLDLQAAADEDADCSEWWRDSDGTSAELLRVQGDEVVVPPRRVVDEAGGLVRPYTEFPHDWRAVAIASATVLEKVRGPSFVSACQRRGLGSGEIEARREQWLGEATECLAWAHAHEPFKRVPQAEADMFWDWLAGLEGIGYLAVPEAAVLAVEATLAESPASVMRMSDAALAPVHARHALAVHNADRVFAATPNRMLSPPSYVQGALEELERAEVLLFEISASDPIGQRFGEGVYQFTIAPEDLVARRFDRVRLTISAA